MRTALVKARFALLSSKPWSALLPCRRLSSPKVKWLSHSRTQVSRSKPAKSQSRCKPNSAGTSSRSKRRAICLSPLSTRPRIRSSRSSQHKRHRKWWTVCATRPRSNISIPISRRRWRTTLQKMRINNLVTLSRESHHRRARGCSRSDSAIHDQIAGPVRKKSKIRSPSYSNQLSLWHGDYSFSGR
jgi:hypothetical protein